MLYQIQVTVSSRSFPVLIFLLIGEYDSNFPSFVTCKTEVGLEEELMMFENPKNEDFLGLPCYGCRLKSLREFPNEVDNPNNILWTSWSTHRRYDGLNNTDCPRIPCIAITYVDHSDIPQSFEDGIIERFKVVIALICSDQVIFDIMRNKTKSDRLIVVNEKEKKILTFVYARDPIEFKECLMYKYQETQFLWTKKDCHEIVTVEEARELIRRARMEIEEKEFI